MRTEAPQTTSPAMGATSAAPSQGRASVAFLFDPSGATEIPKATSENSDVAAGKQNSSFPATGPERLGALLRSMAFRFSRKVPKAFLLKRSSRKVLRFFRNRANWRDPDQQTKVARRGSVRNIRTFDDSEVDDANGVSSIVFPVPIVPPPL
jgi:hypothetical protein